MLVLHANGTHSTVRSHAKANWSHVIERDIPTPGGAATLRMHFRPYADAEPLFDVSLPLPFGEHVCHSPVGFEWSEKGALTAEALASLLRRLHTENCFEAPPVPYRFADVLEDTEEADEVSDVSDVEDNDLSASSDEDDVSDYEQGVLSDSPSVDLDDA